MIPVQSTAPDFSLIDADGASVALSSLRGKIVLLIFYPGDNTPVCTAQLCEYRDNWSAFAHRDVVLLGINTQSTESHAAFSAQYRFPFPLLSDADGAVCKMYGATYFFGLTKRAYVLIDREGIVRYSSAEALPVFKKESDELLALIDAL